MRRRSLLLIVLAASLGALALVGCSGASSTASDSTETTDTTVDSTTTSITTSTTSESTTTTSTRPVATASLAPGSLTGRIITIDPGHNGGNWSHGAEIAREVWIGTGMKACDTSGTATYGGYSETAHNWDVANRTAAILRTAGATVVFTRPDDAGVGPCIDRRAGIGNEAKSDVAISIHADGGPDGGTGFHVMYPATLAGLTESIAPASKQLAVLVRDAYARTTGMGYATYIANQALMERSDLGGLNLTKVPKVFIESGNMRNAGDAAKLTDASFRQQEAEGIAAGLAAFLAGR